MSGGDGAGAGAGAAGDEQSQAEGAAAAAVVAVAGAGEGNGGQNRATNNPHYENIYESVRGDGAAAALIHQQQYQHPHAHSQHHHHQVTGGVAASSSSSSSRNATQSLNRLNHRSVNVDAYGYDVIPGNAGGGARAVSSCGRGVMRRANLHLDLNSNGAGNGRGRHSLARNGTLPPGGHSHSIYNGSLSAQVGQLCPRQHSFDDTESAHYHQVQAPQPQFGATAAAAAMGNYGGSGSGSYRYENLYEQIHEEPIYRNVSSSGSKVYGRLDVIGHGIGRIERHLSSSCGNIDHYNLGGHYAVMGHSHLGAVGHIRMNRNSGNNNSGVVDGSQGTAAAAGSGTSAKDPNVKSSYSSFFNCLSKENSQSMMNMEKSVGSMGQTLSVPGVPVPGNPGENPDTEEGAVGGGGHVHVEKLSLGRPTGAIPKVSSSASSGGGAVSAAGGPPANTTSSANGKSKTKDPNPSQPPNDPGISSSMSLNKLTKSSMQWLMMNKWLPLWMGQGSDCRVMDFNFMFSRKCEGCGDNCRHSHSDNDEELLQFATDDDRNVLRNYGGQPAQFWTPHPTHRTLYGVNHWNEGRLSLRREHSLQHGGYYEQANRGHYDVPRATGRFARDQFLGRSQRPDSPNMGQQHPQQSQPQQQQRIGHWTAGGDPFRNWELNVEHNTFKPANNRVQDVRRITDGTYRKRERERETRAPGQPSSLAAIGKFKFHSQPTEEEEGVGGGKCGVAAASAVAVEEPVKRSSESEDSCSGSSVTVSSALAAVASDSSPSTFSTLEGGVEVEECGGGGGGGDEESSSSAAVIVGEGTEDELQQQEVSAKTDRGRGGGGGGEEEKEGRNENCESNQTSEDDEQRIGTAVDVREDDCEVDKEEVEMEGAAAKDEDIQL